MDKLQMAHEMACAMMASNDGYTVGGAMACAWEYADAMQAELKERKPKGLQQALSPEVTHLNNTLAAQKMVHGSDEWQPDWSQAPEWAKWWAMDGFGDKKAHWYRDKPYLDDDSEVESEWNAGLYSNKDAFVWSPSFSYQGNWKNSLRSRP